MAYTGAIDEQNPDQMFPAAYQAPPPRPDMPMTSVSEAAYNIGKRMGSALHSYTPPSPEYMARSMQGIAAQGGRPPVPDYLQERPTTAAPVLPQRSVAPSFNPSSHDPGRERNFLAEVENSQRGFNAERDTPQQTAAQAAWTPPSRGDNTPQAAPRVYRPGETYSFSNTGAPGSTNMNMNMSPQEALRIEANQRENAANNAWISQQAGNAPQPFKQNPDVDPGLLYGELARRGKSHGDMTTANEYQKTLLAQVHAMLPGAYPKEIRSVMTTISQATRNPTSMNPTQPAQPGAGAPGSLSSAVSSVANPPNYQKLGAGQSIYQMHPDGTARLVTTAPGGAAEQHKNDQFKELQKNSLKMYEDSTKEYYKNWDQITKDVTDPNLKDKALRDLNKNRFMSMGVPEQIAEVPESFTLFVTDKLKPKEYKPWETRPAKEPPLKTKLTREEVESAKAEHKNLMRIRNILANRFYNNALQFKGPGGTQ